MSINLQQSEKWWIYERLDDNAFLKYCDTMRYDNIQFLLHAHIKQFTAWVNI